MNRAHPALLVAFALSLTAGCFRPTPSRRGASNTQFPAFCDVTEAAGLRYHWQISGPRPLNAKQTIGNGCAFLDYNGDGNLDILLVGPKIALYQGDGAGHFTEASYETGVATLSGDFLGCAIGDADNDGFPDIYLSGYREGRLLHNERGEKFRDVTAESGLKPQPFGTSCAWGDFDGDGRLDLYVANYLRFDASVGRLLCDYNGVQSACGPRFYLPERGILYRNLGGLRFADVTETAGVSRAHGKGLGVAFGDADGSGRQSLAVANDEMPGDLFKNRGGRFEEAGEISGVAYDSRGGVHGGMGLDWGDYDNDGKLDLAVTTFQAETKCVYRNEGESDFAEMSGVLGISAAAPLVSFGVKWLDFDNDGRLDLILASGHIQDNISAIDHSASYRQPICLFHNGSSAHFENVSVTAFDESARRPIVGRGLATGDYDNDGKKDVLVVDSEGAPLLLHNQNRAAGNFLTVRLVGGGKSNRDAYGAKVTAIIGRGSFVRYCHADGSYLSSSDCRVHFGLGAATRINKILVRWPDGNFTERRNVSANAFLNLDESEMARKETLARNQQ